MHQYYRKFAFAVVAALLVICILILSMTMSSTNVSAVEANGVGVYWDINCSNRVSAIDWGALQPGAVKNVAVYIRNEGEEPTYLILSTTNWKPSRASQYLYLTWDHSGRINPGETLQVTLTLSVSRRIEGISSFAFDIIITGSQNLPGDVNGDGSVNITDVILVFLNMGPVPPKPTTYDVNGDGTVNIADVIICFLNMR